MIDNNLYYFYNFFRKVSDMKNNDNTGISPSYYDRIRADKTYLRFIELYRINLDRFRSCTDDFLNSRIVPDKSELLSISESVCGPFDHSRITILDMLSVLEGDETDRQYSHSFNVSLICRYAGKWFLPDDEAVAELILCAFYYDLGLFRIPSDIANMTHPLNGDELDTYMSHPVYSYNLIQNLSLDINIKLCALMHHERCDGNGYPQQLSADRINRYARIIAIIDRYESLISERTENAVSNPFEVIGIFENEGPGKYDALYYLAFLEHIADEYIGYDVMLNDGTVCSIVLNNKQKLSRPMLRAGEDCIDLTRNDSLYIDKLL